jgi:uncharacterized protein YndB with AHSA1/START domain
MSASEQPGTISGDGKTRTARFERVLAHPPADVWEALTSSDALGRWLTRASIEPRLGGEARFDFGDGPVTAVVTVWEPPRALAYRWPFPEHGAGHIAWTLEAIDRGTATRLVLEHTGLPVDWAAGYGSGWHAYLDRLAAQLAGQKPPDWAERVASLGPAYDTNT